MNSLSNPICDRTYGAPLRLFVTDGKTGTIAVMHTLLPGSNHTPIKRKVNVLAYVTDKVGPGVLPHLMQCPDVHLKVVSDCTKAEFKDYLESGTSIANIHWIANDPVDPYRHQKEMTGHKLAKWADVLFIIGNAGLVSLMLAGLTTDVILHILRCWDSDKRILLLPELSAEQQSNPVWKRQILKLQEEYEWVQVLRPATWELSYLSAGPQITDIEDREPKLEWNWDGEAELQEVLHSETQTVLRKARGSAFPSKMSSKSALPSEIWALIFHHLGDWEVSTALNIYTKLEVPVSWRGLVPQRGKQRTLEWMILTQSIAQIRAFFEKQPKDQPLTLSPISLHIIFRFARTDVLTYLFTYQKDIFWTSFPSQRLPHRASCIYNSTAILQWWKDYPAVISKDNLSDAAAIDGASRAGYIEVLQWWLDSGLTLEYSERALENASSRGLVEVLEWWKTNHQRLAGTERELPLKVGKSIWLAAQCGRANSIAWWERSGIAYSHEERVATFASQGGHVEVLELWHSLKGSKMIFDNQVLVGPTKHGHANVLEWWKDASRKWNLRVEYKTCDIEEAMEDAIGGGGEGEVREWWARNGLNLGVGTGEWMKIKTL